MLLSNRTGRLRRIKALIIKEFYQILRDPSSIMISIVLPLVLLFLYGFGVSLDLDHLRVALVLEDTAPDAQSFAKAMTDSPYFDVKIGRDRREFTHDILSGAIRGIVVVPSYFTIFRNLSSTVAPIQVIADGSEPNTANFVQNYVAFAWQNWLRQEAISNRLTGLPLVTPNPRFWYNQELESRDFLVPGSLAIIMTLIGTLLTSLVVAREWERGTMEALMATPVSIVEILIGKLIPYFILGMGSMVLCVIVAKILYDIPFRGSWWVLLMVASCFLTTALGLGLVISIVTKNQFAAAQAAMVAAFLPAYILSGFIFEIGSMPYFIQLLTYLVPAKYFVTSLQTIFLVGDIWKLLIWNIIPMILIGLAFFLISARISVKRLD
jgi:ABC-2 type transport system permease protein